MIATFLRAHHESHELAVELPPLLADPFTFPEATLGTKLALTAMHLILTAAIVGAIAVRGRTPRSEP